MKILVGTFITVCFIACIAKSDHAQENNFPDKIIAEDSIVQIQISSVGDLMCHSTQSKYAKVGTDTFNFLPCYEYVLPWLQKPDFLIGNLETTFGGKGLPYSGFPRFNSPDDYADALKKAGFDFIVTANNHTNDTYEAGILRTIDVLDKTELPHTGSFASQKDRDSIRVVDIKGIKIGIIAYTYSTNGIDLTPGKPWLTNYCDSALIKKDIQLARKAGAELVCVFYHFGEEYQRMPSVYQNNFVNWAIDNGADIILGSHPHVLQPANFYKTNSATLDTGFVAYSMGNFISNQQDNFTDEGIIFNLHISKNLNTGKIKIEKVEYVPTWVYKGVNAEKKLHIVFPLLDYTQYNKLEFVSNIELQEMKNAQEHTKDLMNKMTNTIHAVQE